MGIEWGRVDKCREMIVASVQPGEAIGGWEAGGSTALEDVGA